MKTKFLTTCCILSLFILSAVITPTTAAPVASKPTVSTHPIEYHIGCGQAMIWDGSLEYFKSHGFSTVHLIVNDQKAYKEELAKIKSLGMRGIIDIEIPIWDGGKKKDVPIENFASYFQSLKAAGWEYVASEGGREGDANYLARYFTGYVNYNCDKCGLWENMHLQSGTVMNSWESFYPQEWQSIQQGAKESAALGKKNGILAGVWEGSTNLVRQNSLTGGSPSYKEMLDWSYANGVGFTHFHVWCSNKGLATYKQLGFEQIVTELQKTYPATTTASSAGSAAKATPAPTVKPIATPKATPTVKAVATPKATPTVKPIATPKVTPTAKATPTPQLAKTALVTAKATSTPTLVTASKQASAVISVSEVIENDSVPGLSFPTDQTDGIASLLLQPVSEFSLLVIGIPAAIAGAIYIFMRRG